jgi:hypothetical protein
LSLVQVGAKVILVQLYLNSVCGMLGTVGGDEAQTLVCSMITSASATKAIRFASSSAFVMPHGNYTASPPTGAT